jgi:hypothetical protein
MSIICKYRRNTCVLLPLGIGTIIASVILNNNKEIIDDITENKKIQKAFTITTTITNSILFHGGIGVLTYYGAAFLIYKLKNRR